MIRILRSLSICSVVALFCWQIFAADPPATTNNSAGGLLESLTAKRDAAGELLNLSNAHGIGLGFQMYVEKFHRFPASSIVGKDGKTARSCAFELLPFLGDEEAKLYKEYRLDEPWDSESNRKLLDKMPAVYRDAFDDPKSTHASFFMPQGKGTIGDDPQGTSEYRIRDGLGRTIVLIEAKREIPWTKPADIEIDPDATKPLPKVGWGRPGGTMAAALADGSAAK